MIKPIEMYTVICDRCHKDLFTESEFRAWQDEESALACALEDEGLQIINDRHICSDCWIWDENDNIIEKGG